MGRTRSEKKSYYRNFDKEKIFEMLDNIEIKQDMDEVVTLFNGREVSRAKVSDRYEIFDFRPFVKKAINEISEKYEISTYMLTFTGGRQEIKLHSSPIQVGKDVLHKTFFLLNSSDKTRALNLAYGLTNQNYVFISNSNSINKRHYTGITELVETNFDISDEAFNEQIGFLKSLSGTHIKISKLEGIIKNRKKQKFASKKSGTNTLERNFKMFCKKLVKHNVVTQPDLVTKLLEDNTNFKSKVNDFHINSYEAFKVYMGMFMNRDSYEIKKESIRIMEMTTEVERTRKIDALKNTNEMA